MEKQYYIIYITVRVGQLSPLNFCLLAGATEPQIPGQPGTRTVSSPRQSTLWTVKCSLHYALKMCKKNVYLFVTTSILAHPCISFYSIPFYHQYHSCTQLLICPFLSIYIYICVFFLFSSYFLLSLCTGSLCHKKKCLVCEKHTWK